MAYRRRNKNAAYQNHLCAEDVMNVEKPPKKGQNNFSCSINLHLGALSLRLSGTAGYLLIRSLHVKTLICRGTEILTFGKFFFFCPPLTVGSDQGI